MQQGQEFRAGSRYASTRSPATASPDRLDYVVGKGKAEGGSKNEFNADWGEFDNIAGSVLVVEARLV